MKNPSGYEEIEHTADWALHVWAPSLGELFQLAAAGMYQLAGTRYAPGQRERRVVELEGLDHEVLLVRFLTWLVLLGEREGLGAADTTIEMIGLDGTPKLRAEMSLAKIGHRDKEIKAVTYHNLEVLQTSAGWEVTIVFDV